MAPPQTLPDAPSPLHARYDARVASGDIQDDRAQREALDKLALLAEAMEARARLLKHPVWRLLKRWVKAPRGLYIWGNVGRGKSMLMDMFFAHVDVAGKRRIHFHAFMQEVHQRMHGYRAAGKDPVGALVAEIAQQTPLLCFDELQATDPADATVLFRLFDGLLKHGVVVVSTSNRPPASLYTGGVQKERFAKFIGLIERQMEAFALSSPTDYRHMQMKSMEQVYFWPLGAHTDAHIQNVIEQICDDCRPKKDEFVVQGRRIPFQLYGGGVGVFTFQQLCASALGAADYLAIARRLDTVVLAGIPRLSAEMRNEAKRFVTLIDALYEHKVMLVAGADAPPHALYAEGDGHFEFQRTVSRLAEMQSKRYLEH
jgi:cell division protein ZapE